jgi:hypothetical protein
VTQPEPVVVEPIAEESALVMEAAFAALVLVALGKFLKRAAEAVFAPLRFGSGLPNPSGILSLDTYWSELVDGLLDDLIRAAKVGWDDAARQLGMVIPFDRNSPILTEQLLRTRNLLVNVDHEVYRQVVKAISVGMDQGATDVQIAGRVSQILDVSGTPNWPNRADVIARTEVRRFLSAGQLSGSMVYAQRTGARLIKEWVDRDDSRVRPAHALADGQRRELTDLFDVGSSRLRYPGDPMGAAQDVINERCAMRIRQVRR